MSENQITNNADPVGGARAWFVWSLAALTFGYAFFHRVTPSVMVSDLMAEFAIGGAMLGTLSALYFYPYVLAQVPLGAILDKLGTRYLLASAIILAAVGSFIFGSANSIEMAYLGRILIGIGSSVGFLSTLTLAANWFPANRFSMLTGLTMFFGMMSGMLAQAPLALLIEIFGWRNAMWSLGIFGALLALMIFAFVRNSPPGAKSPINKKHAPDTISRQNATSTKKPRRSNLLLAASTLEVWKVALVAGTMSGPMLTLGGLWGTPYFMAAYNIERPQAAFFMSLMLVGWAFGAPSSGWLADRYKRFKLNLITGSTILVLCLAAIVFLPTPPLWLNVSLFTIAGISGSFMTTSFALIRSVTSPKISGSVSGIVNSLTVASGAILQPFVGYLLDNFWDGKMVAGARVYGVEDYQWSFSIVLATTLVGLITAICLKDTPFDGSKFTD